VGAHVESLKPLHGSGDQETEPALGLRRRGRKKRPSNSKHCGDEASSGPQGVKKTLDGQKNLSTPGAIKNIRKITKKQQIVRCWQSGQEEPACHLSKKGWQVRKAGNAKKKLGSAATFYVPI